MKQVDMIYRNLGRSGLKVSALGLGGWNSFGSNPDKPLDVKSIITQAFDAGVNFFDMADAYAAGQAEVEMGEIFKEFPRHDLVLATKVFFPMGAGVNNRGLSRKHIMEGVSQSLQRIGTDYIDILYCHRYDPETPLEETVRALDDLIRQGKVLYWGTSQWEPEQIKEAYELCMARGYVPPQAEQPQYNLLHRAKLESSIRPALDTMGMGLTVWSPLASGILSGKYSEGIQEGSRLARVEWLQDIFYKEDIMGRVEKLKPLAEDLECSMAQLALAWAMHQSGISSVITGATTVQQLRENLGSLSIAYTDELDKALHAIFPPDPNRILTW